MSSRQSLCTFSDSDQLHRQQTVVFSGTFHVMIWWVKRFAELKPQRSLFVSLSEQIKCLRSLVLILTGSGLCVLLLPELSSQTWAQRWKHQALGWWSRTWKCFSDRFLLAARYIDSVWTLIWMTSICCCTTSFSQRQFQNSFMKVDKNHWLVTLKAGSALWGFMNLNPVFTSQSCSYGAKFI